MKTPHLEKFKEILFCNTYRKECAKIDKTKIECNGCSTCPNSEKIYEERKV